MTSGNFSADDSRKLFEALCKSIEAKVFDLPVTNSSTSPLSPNLLANFKMPMAALFSNSLNNGAAEHWKASGTTGPTPTYASKPMTPGTPPAGPVPPAPMTRSRSLPQHKRSNSAATITLGISSTKVMIKSLISSSTPSTDGGHDNDNDRSGNGKRGRASGNGGKGGSAMGMHAGAQESTATLVPARQTGFMTRTLSTPGPGLD
jgi:hypothetical protein